MHTQVVECNSIIVAVNTTVVVSDSAYKSCQLQLCIQKLPLAIVYSQFFNVNGTYEMNDYLQ